MTVQGQAGLDRATTLQALREQAEHWVDLLLTFLDATDDYLLTGLEEDGAEPTNEAIRAIGQVIGCLEDDEPSLAWSDEEAGTGHHAPIDRYLIDREEQCDDEGDTSDSGIGDYEGLMEQAAGAQQFNGIGAIGFASHVE